MLSYRPIHQCVYNTHIVAYWRSFDVETRKSWLWCDRSSETERRSGPVTDNDQHNTQRQRALHDGRRSGRVTVKEQRPFICQPGMSSRHSQRLLITALLGEQSVDSNLVRSAAAFARWRAANTALLFGCRCFAVSLVTFVRTTVPRLYGIV